MRKLLALLLCVNLLFVISGCSIEHKEYFGKESEESLADPYVNKSADYIVNSYDIKQTQAAVENEYVTLNLDGPENSGILSSDTDKTDYNTEQEKSTTLQVVNTNTSGSSANVSQLKSSVTWKTTTITLKMRDEFKATDEDKQWLYACTMAEAGGQGLYGMILVADVIITRAVKYKTTCKAIITSPGQFTTYSNGSIAKLMKSGVSSDCKKACNSALAGADYSKGAYYFNSANPHLNGTYMFTWKGHYFARV